MAQNNRTIKLTPEDWNKYLVIKDYAHDESHMYLNDFFAEMIMNFSMIVIF